MPGKGYSTIGLKPTISSRLHKITDCFYPGMFLPSTLIILMNEVQCGYYSIDMHKLSLDLSGRYNTITIRSDVKEWLMSNFENSGEEYKKKYNIKCFANFVSYFLANLFESKFNSQNHVIRLKESDFGWLQKEYMLHQKKNG
ncbi:MAG: hypothetical protein COW27_01580, partial [Nitrosopumilales archaeon CG15_BIG_FIL_POST_REV_8_21_14_020_37_12]